VQLAPRVHIVVVACALTRLEVQSPRSLALPLCHLQLAGGPLSAQIAVRSSRIASAGAPTAPWQLAKGCAISENPVFGT